MMTSVSFLKLNMELLFCFCYCKQCITIGNGILESACECFDCYEFQKKYSGSVSLFLLDNVWVGGMAILDWCLFCCWISHILVSSQGTTEEKI
jgi:hypothetical protein